MVNKSNVKNCKNIKLYNSIMEYYVTGLKTQKEIADMNEITIGSLKNFLFRYDISKKTNYSKKKSEIIEKLSKGYSVKDVAKIMDLSPQTIYIYKEQYENGTLKID